MAEHQDWDNHGDGHTDVPHADWDDHTDAHDDWPNWTDSGHINQPTEVGP